MDVKSEYRLFIGNYENVIGEVVYHRYRNKYIPCHVTNYYFKSRKYALVPVDDLVNISAENHEKRRVFYTTRIYITEGMKFI